MTLRSFISNNLVVLNLNVEFSLYSYFFILFGFLVGNLFGCFFSILPLSSISIIISLLLFLEIYSYLYYKSFSIAKKKNKSQNNIFPKQIKKSTTPLYLKAVLLGDVLVATLVRSKALLSMYSTSCFAWPRSTTTLCKLSTKKTQSIAGRPAQGFNFLKIGFLFGVFVDAFKVGS